MFEKNWSAATLTKKKKSELWDVWEKMELLQRQQLDFNI